ncbi:hypothetical protein NMY22_g18825 [Coprinellus aureogranulatus]|nr:hypothetical protein NMY22_g18825 [Coprinellus aureogranulatus]
MLLLTILTLQAAWSVSAAPVCTDDASTSIPASAASNAAVATPSAPTSAIPSTDAPSNAPAPAPTSTGSTDSLPGHGGMNEAVTVATGWYPAWEKESFPPSAIPWSRYNMMTFSFALTTQDPSVLDLVGEEETLRTFAAEAKKNNVTSLISVGGWTGSQHFSSAVATEDSRAAFQKAILGMVTEYGLDGVDFDWEYPNADGIGCNEKSPQDAENFLTFLKGLRADPAGANLVLTAATSTKPFNGPDATPLQDVSGFAEALDFLAIMNYDIWGSWAQTTGPNAPLKDSCAPTGSQMGSAESAVAAWTAAKFPANQILLGVAAYGHSFRVDLSAAKSSNGALSVYAPFDKANQPLGEGETSSVPTPNKCGVPEGPAGVWTFRGMIENGFLGPDGNPAEGIDYTFDECSETPFVYQQQNQTFISFDDAKSFTAKGEFINQKDLRGFAVWHVLGDSADNILLDAIHQGIGTEMECVPEPEAEPTAEPTSQPTATPTQTSPVETSPTETYYA